MPRLRQTNAKARAKAMARHSETNAAQWQPQDMERDVIRRARHGKDQSNPIQYLSKRQHMTWAICKTLISQGTQLPGLARVDHGKLSPKTTLIIP